MTHTRSLVAAEGNQVSSSKTRRGSRRQGTPLEPVIVAPVAHEAVASQLRVLSKFQFVRKTFTLSCPWPWVDNSLGRLSRLSVAMCRSLSRTQSSGLVSANLLKTACKIRLKSVCGIQTHLSIVQMNKYFTINIPFVGKCAHCSNLHMRMPKRSISICQQLRVENNFVFIFISLFACLFGMAAHAYLFTYAYAWVYG